MRIRSAVPATALLFSLTATTLAPAQCELAWLPGAGNHGTSGNPYQEHVYALHRWDPDGPGPAPMRLVFGGSFPTIASIPASRIASWDPATGEWAGFGVGISNDVNALATAANGDLLAGGGFQSAGGAIARNIARWNGTAWSALGEGLNGRVHAIAPLANGDVVAVGEFTTTGNGTVVNRVAQWNGSSWSSMGNGAPTIVRAALALPNGDVVVGGEFTSIGGVAASRIARWNGSTWQPLGAGVDGLVADLTLRPGGDVVAAGSFVTAGGVAARRVAGWDGNNWYAFGSGLDSNVRSVHVEDNGNLLANAPVTFGAPGISRWDGVSWQPAAAAIAGLGLPTTVPGGDIVLAGEFTVTAPDGTTLHDVARFDGSAWVELQNAASPWNPAALPGVRAVAATSDGTLYATGAFQSVDGVQLNGIARLSGSTWQPVGSSAGINSPPFPYPWTSTLIATRNDDIVVGGRILQIVSGPAGHIARWDGSAWDNLGGGVGTFGAVTAIAELRNGDLVAGGTFDSAHGGPGDFLARWDGTGWHPLGSGATGAIQALVAMPNGDLIAAGDFTIAGTNAHTARWDGSEWHLLGNGPGQPVTRLRLLPDGDVVAIVGPTPPGNGWTVKRWDGASWTQLAAAFFVDSLTDLVVLPGGGLLLTGNDDLVGETWRWNGYWWTPVEGTDLGFDAHTWMPDGDLVVAGWFESAGPWLSRTLARLQSNCAPTAAVSGAGCAGSGGSNTLAAATLPWLGATFRAAGTELPTLSLVSQVWGVTPTQLPLSLLLPEAPPGCDLLVSPDFVDFALITDGTIETAIALPNNPALAGVQLHHQLNLFEVDPSLNLLEVTASNALVLTTGVF